MHEKDPSAAAVVMHKVTLKGDFRSVWYTAFTGEFGAKPKPDTTTDSLGVPDDGETLTGRTGGVGSMAQLVPSEDSISALAPDSSVVS
jgi:hypothetical protein